MNDVKDWLETEEPPAQPIADSGHAFQAARATWQTSSKPPRIAQRPTRGRDHAPAAAGSLSPCPRARPPGPGGARRIEEEESTSSKNDVHVVFN